MSFIYCGWQHCNPSEIMKENRVDIIKRLCFGPLETDIWGIKDGKFFSEYIVIEGFEENEFKYIDKYLFFNELDYEISLCKRNNDEELANKLIRIKEELIK